MTIKKVSEKHLQEIKRMNKKYPLMEYFLDRKPLKSCSKECQEQVVTIILERPFKSGMATIESLKKLSKELT